MDSLLLFAEDGLSSDLHSRLQRVAERLVRWDPDALLKAPEADVVEELLEEATVQCPSLARDRIWMPQASEITLTFERYGDVVEQRVTRFVFVVPFEGEAAVFTLRPSTYRPNGLRAVSLDEQELHIAVDSPAGGGSGVRRRFDEQLAGVEEHLGWARQQVDQHNQMMRAQIPGMVSRRRAELLATRNIQAEIGFPIRQRSDAETYSVPIKRRKLRPVQPRPTATPFKPEPVMADSDYEAALAVLRNSRNALERTPSLAARLDEQQIRDLLLVNLNAHFEGDAAGEVFNGAGKTDILIRVQDRNIFIGECKIWGGPSTMDQALGQIFSYLVWRDTKAAILLFIRNKGVTAVIRKAVEKIESHPNFKRRGASHTDDRLDFVVRAEDDPEREIKLALLPFALRTGARQREDGAPE